MILFVDDDNDALTQAYLSELRAAGYTVEHEVSPGQAAARLERGEPFTLLVTDLMMTPDGDLDARRADHATRTGLLVLERFRARRPGRPAIVLTVVPDNSLRARVNPPLERFLRKRDVLPGHLARHVQELLALAPT